ncbi:MAG: VOC family protein [Solirubrobacterales bacterium]
MPEMTSYEPGTPCWVDLGSPDLEASVSFYQTLFGWSIPETPTSEQTGGYRQAMAGGRPVAGMMPLMAEDQPPVWSSYASVADADATVAAVGEAGGAVIAEPMEVMDLGKMAVFTDPTGAVFGIWEPGTFIGAGLVNEPVSLSWNELNTRDPGAAREFYGAVFGWTAEEAEMPDGGTYVQWHRDGEDAVVGGMLDVRGRLPDEIPAHWLVYFAVGDCDATVEKAKELGGELNFGPMDLPVGRFAVLSDLHGSHFAVIALSCAAS